MNEWIFLLNGVAVTLFGSILSASFCNAFNSKRNRMVFLFGIIFTLLLQGWIISFWEIAFLRNIYPLMIHLPLVLMLYLLTGKFLWSLISVLSAYMCCQLRRWLALLVVTLASGGDVMQSSVELIITVPLLFFLLKTVSPEIRILADRNFKNQFQFGLIPALYYVFDYATVVYTDMLIKNYPVVAEFMPFVCCVAYLVFLMYHSAEEQKRNQLQQIQENLDIQLKQSVREIGALRESQALARQYRHDLRHHLQYVSACIENGQSEQAQAYISGICKEIEAQKVERYCENEAANLILSAFVGQAKKNNIKINVQGSLSETIAVSDSDLCVLFSNALENAIHACQVICDLRLSLVIDVRFYIRDEKFFLQVTNPCGSDIRFEKGVPVSDSPGHGIGVQSICTIVERYGGIYSFSVQNGNFILRLSI
ncbi:MAG: GHKL domain-containing protein [Clostridia bacterium]|nr:GHKL domain-containing protein [Clostridia bacterium]